MKAKTIILAIVISTSCNKPDPSIVHTDGDYVITMEKYTGHDGEYFLRTQVKYKGVFLISNSYVDFEEKRYVTIWDTTCAAYAAHAHADADATHWWRLRDSLIHITYIDSLAICNKLEMALADIERDKLKKLNEAAARALRQAKIDSVEYWINNVKEICK